MSYCPECGGRTSNGVCSNCQEELYILRNQADVLDQPMSVEFMAEVDEQYAFLKRKERIE